MNQTHVRRFTAAAAKALSKIWIKSYCKDATYALILSLKNQYPTRLAVWVNNYPSSFIQNSDKPQSESNPCTKINCWSCESFIQNLDKILL